MMKMVQTVELMLAKVKTNQDTLATMKAKLYSNQEETKTDQERMEAKIAANYEKVEVLRNKMWTSQEEMKAMLEANPEEIKCVAEDQEVPNELAAVEMIGALKDRSGDRHLTVRRCGWLTCHAIPEWREDRSLKGVMVGKRRWKAPNATTA
jgi:hypothetical protein